MIRSVPRPTTPTTEHWNLMRLLRYANLVVAFALELGAFAAFAYWGAESFDGVLAILAAVLAPSSAIVLWAVFGAPKSSRRLPPAQRLPFEFVIFGLAVVALVAVDRPLLGLTFGAVAIVSVLLGVRLGQWNE
jgi:hypothetical protein